MGKATAILGALGLAAAATAPAALKFDVNFESPAYAVGDTFSSATNSGTLSRTGPSPSKLTGLTVGSANWTATVEAAGPTGNRLTFANTAAGVALGRLEAFDPPVGGGAGTWFVQMDYTRLTSSGGFLLSMRPVNNVGQTMVGHPNNMTLYADNWDGHTLAVGSTHTLRTEVDMGTTVVRAYFDGVLSNTYSTLGTNVTTFGGLQLEAGSTSYAVGNVFALDNIQVGFVPEPASLALLGCGVFLAARRRRT